MNLYLAVFLFACLVHWAVIFLCLSLLFFFIVHLVFWLGVVFCECGFFAFFGLFVCLFFSGKMCLKILQGGLKL